jgi:hypothetical protein
MSFRLLASFSLLLTAACGSSAEPAADAAHPVADRQAPDRGAPDQSSAPDQTRADLARDRSPASPEASAAWPPPIPYHNLKVCSLPPCDPKAPEVTDLSGSWTQKITTKSQTCNALAQAMKKELQPGNVQTLTGQKILRAGECIYKDAIGGKVVGVIKGNVMITCEVLPVDSGVTPIAEGQVTFNGSTGSGPAWTYLFDVPLPPVTCQANCTIEMLRE